MLLPAKTWPILAKLKAGKVLGQTTAISRDILQSEEQSEERAPIYLDGELEKATKAHPQSTLEIEYDRARDRLAQHAPVVRYEARDILVTPAGLYTAGSALRINAPTDLSALLRTPLVETDAAAICDTGVTLRYFGHLIQDALPTALLAQEGEVPVITTNPKWQDVPAYFTGLGIDPIRMPLHLAKRAVWFEDFGQGTLKRQRYQTIRKRLRDAYPASQPGKRIYFKRPAGGDVRTIINEGEMIQALTQAGFVVVDPSSMKAEELLPILMDASVSVGIDGSHLNHLYFTLAEGAVAVCLIENDRFTMQQADYSRANGLVPAFMVLEGQMGVGYRVDVPGLLKTLEKAGVQ